MTSAGELFVIALARASKRARRHLRGLERAERDDVLSTAILWCWENRTTYNPSVSLEDWFIGAIRNARQEWERGEIHTATELIEAIAVPDDTSERAELLQLQERIQKRIEAMPEAEQRIAVLQAHGYTQDEIIKKESVSARIVSDVRRKLAPMKQLLPDNRDWAKVLRASPKDEPEEGKESWIDREIARLEFAPPAGKDCPPCWRCKWFDGYAPAPNTVRRAPITLEPEIRAAVLDVEARKIDIAYGLRRGGR